MRPSRADSARLAALADVAFGVRGAHAASPRHHWSQITHVHSGSQANLGLAGGNDGTLHVLWAGPARAPFTSILDTRTGGATF
jgi:hypothetical protein